MERLGPYKIIRNIASGGMGEVYLAALERVGGFEKTVALKCILPRLMDEQRFIDLFEREARLAAVLSHRNIVQIFDFGRSDERAWLAMEYVKGVDLKRLARRVQTLPINLIVEIGIQCARGLHYAHRAKDARGQPLNIIHRDVSPQNILLSYQGDAKIADFGLAHAAAQGIDDDGVLKGKFGYMSPEQALAKPLDERTDQFSLGIVLFELLTGVRAFYDPEGAAVTLARIRDGRLRAALADIQPEIPETIRLCIERSLSTDRRDRFADMGQFAATLEAAAHSSGLKLGVSQLGEWLRATIPETEDSGFAEFDVTGEGTAVAADPILSPVLPPARDKLEIVSATEETFAASRPDLPPLFSETTMSENMANTVEPSDATPSQFSATLLDVDPDSAGNVRSRMLLMGILLGLTALMLVYSNREPVQLPDALETGIQRTKATVKSASGVRPANHHQNQHQSDSAVSPPPSDMSANRLAKQATRPTPPDPVTDEKELDIQQRAAQSASNLVRSVSIKATPNALKLARRETRRAPVSTKPKNKKTTAKQRLKKKRQLSARPVRKNTVQKAAPSPVTKSSKSVGSIENDQPVSKTTAPKSVEQVSSKSSVQQIQSKPRLRPGAGGTRFRAMGKGAVNGWYEVGQSGRLLTAKSPDGVRLIIRVFNRNSRFSAAIHSKPSGQLTVNGIGMGETPIASAPLSTGTHRVRVQTTDGRQMSVVFRLAK
ncbi:MAG: protein kinase [Myxococcota bacterium]|nr:protein kinase [Myxococcota bacterium]